MNSSLKSQVVLSLRYDIRIELTGEVFVYGEKAVAIGSLVDLSVGGCSVTNSELEITEGSEVYLVIHSAHFQSPIRAKGKISRIDESSERRLAIEFTLLNRNSQNEIERLAEQTDRSQIKGIEWG